MKQCVLCKGSVSPGTINHIVDLDGQIIIIKNAPATVCAQCGEGYITHEHAVKLEQMVDKARMQGMEIVIMHYSDIAA